MKYHSILLVFYFFHGVIVALDKSAGNSNSTEIDKADNKQTNSTKKESAQLWYGKSKNVPDTFGCDWPNDFQKRYGYCAEKYLPKNIIPTGKPSPSQFGEGILNHDIMESLLNCGNNCNLSMDSHQLETQIKIWWENIDKLAQFKICLKHNTESIVRMCGADTEISQVMSGMAGLYLNLLDVIFDTYTGTTELNETNHCAMKMAEAVHVTTAMYVTTQYYWQNSVLCWEVTTKTSCSSLCKRFATVLQCVGATCPHLKSALPRFAIWQWYFGDIKKSQTTCSLVEDDKSCLSDTVSVSGQGSNVANVSQAQRLFDTVKEKYNEFKTQVETSLHVPFYIFLIITLSSFAVFIIVVLLICLWYNGVLGGRKTKVLRYTKLLNNDNKKQLRVNVDETKSLTRDFDDVE